jgi:hypothetical protein
MEGKWAVRKGFWKLIGSGENGIELFNLENDIGELKNLMNDYPAIADSLEKSHKIWFREVNTAMPLKLR